MVGLMSTSNGVMTPPLPQNGTTSNPSAKRKRTDDGPEGRVDEAEYMSRNGIERDHGDNNLIASFLLDVLEVLRRWDVHLP